MREYENYEFKYEQDPIYQQENVGEFPVSIPEDTDGLDSVADVPVGGDVKQNGSEGTDMAESMEVLTADGFSSEMTAFPNDIPEDVPTEDFESEPTDSIPSKIPEDVDGNTDMEALSDLDGWLGDINPNYDEFDTESPYSNNCGSCAYAVYQRLEGNADACASAENIPYNEDMEELTGMEQVSMDPSEIEQRLLEQGDGAHAIIGIDRAEGAGHWFNAACINGKVVAIDGQTGEVSDWPPDYGDVINWEMSVKKGE